MKRKDFTGRLLSAWVAICSLPAVYGIFQYLMPPAKARESAVPFKAGLSGEYASGAVRQFKEGRNAFFVRASMEGQIRAFSARCTHLGCLVEYLEEDREFRCNCHGSRFDADGRNLTGPASTPLQPYRVEVKGDNVIVTIG